MRRLLAGDVAQLCASSLYNGDAHVAGDANRDGSYDPADVKQVLEAGKYSSDEPAGWSEGDWNADSVFDELDLVEALAMGNYLQGPHAAVARDVAFAKSG